MKPTELTKRMVAAAETLGDAWGYSGAGEIRTVEQNHCPLTAISAAETGVVMELNAETWKRAANNIGEKRGGNIAMAADIRNPVTPEIVSLRRAMIDAVERGGN